MHDYPARSSLNGLTSVEAARRLAAEGPNEVPQKGRRSVLHIIAETLREPMFALLLASAVIYLLIGNRSEALLLLAFACSSVSITIIQESRSERVLDALRELTSPRALVIRDGTRVRVPSREVVRGDYLVLSEGDRVAADGIVRLSEDLQADESMLTGEAVPVRKNATDDVPDLAAAPGGDDLPLIFSGTLVIRGRGVAEVSATGSRSRVGQIGQSLTQIDIGTPHLTSETRRIVRIFAVIALACCIAVFVLFGLFRTGWMQAALAGIALGMSMIPEEFPLVLAVFTAMGAWRLSQARVLTRRASAIETLGSATVLCTDKTGTLTENRMSIAELWTEDTSEHAIGGDTASLRADALDLLHHGVLASATEPFDPMEKAFHTLYDSAGSYALHNGGQKLAKIYPLHSGLLAVTQAWLQPDNTHIVAVKGAPEAIIQLCNLDESQTSKVRLAIERMASAGLRVLGIAKARHGKNLPPDPWGFQFDFLGLAGLSDPIRANVPQAIHECQNAGIRVIMITGDYPSTARAIAASGGISAAETVTGAEIASMSDEDLRAAAGTVSIFARIMPDQKLRLVRALKERGETVAMTGDGVNDAPALRAANIGIAMGNRGTDVAREAADLVLLDDDFSSIVRTVRLGRRIYDNLRKAMGYIIAVHIPIAGMALIPLLTGAPIILAPIHIAFLEMVIDPICSIAFEAEKEERNIMARPPRSPLAKLLSAPLAEWSILQGLVALIFIGAAYFTAFHFGMADDRLRTLTFSMLVCTNLGLVLVNRSFSAGTWRLISGSNLPYWMVATAALLLLMLACIWSPARNLFGFSAFEPLGLIIVFGAAGLLVLCLEALKALRPQRYLQGLTS